VARDFHFKESKNRIKSIEIDSTIFNLEIFNQTNFTDRENYYKIITSDYSNCFIHWGNKSLHKKSNKKFYCNEFKNLHFEWENNKFISVKSSRGSDSWFNIFLPLEESAQEVIYENILAYDKKNNLIAAEFLSKDTVLDVYNLVNGKHLYIIEKSYCESAFNHYCIDTIFFQDNQLIYNWILPNKLEENQKISNRKIYLQ
jgi:hypothetical protein